MPRSSTDNLAKSLRNLSMASPLRGGALSDLFGEAANRLEELEAVVADKTIAYNMQSTELVTLEEENEALRQHHSDAEKAFSEYGDLVSRAEKAERERDEAREANKRLREAVEKVLPPEHGEFGGPLVQMVAYYEDGSPTTMSPFWCRAHIHGGAVTQARAALRGGDDE